MAGNKPGVFNYPGIVEVEALLENPEELNQVKGILERTLTKLAGKDSRLSAFIERAIPLIGTKQGYLQASDENSIQELRFLIDFPEERAVIFKSLDKRPDGFDRSGISELWRGITLGGGEISEKAFLVGSLLRHYKAEEAGDIVDASQVATFRVIDGGKE